LWSFRDDHPASPTRVVLDEVEEFLTGVRPRPSTERVLATILFRPRRPTQRATLLGDAAWRDSSPATTRRFEPNSAASGWARPAHSGG
jgi:hypothetical protein